VSSDAPAMNVCKESKKNRWISQMNSDEIQKNCSIEQQCQSLRHRTQITSIYRLYNTYWHWIPWELRSTTANWWSRKPRQSKTREPCQFLQLDCRLEESLYIPFIEEIDTWGKQLIWIKFIFSIVVKSLIICKARF
jgi:hypothetical protein